LAGCHQMEHDIDVLVADVVLPGLGDVEMAQQAVAARPVLKVLLITGFAPAGEVCGAGAFPILLKPFSPDEIQAAVARLLRGHR
jgi:DNA-binding NtrC family response regulator